MYSPTLGRWAQLDPIGFAAGDANLYRFVGNNPVNRLDPSGLIDITIDLQGKNKTDEEERSHMPNDTIWSGQKPVGGVLLLIKEKAGGNKIKRLTLTAHCGNAGTVHLASGDVLSAGELTKLEQAKANGTKLDAVLKNIDEYDRFLREVASMTDDGGMTIDFVQCTSGQGPKGQQLIAEISKACGGKVKIIMYDDNVKWFKGQPRMASVLDKLLSGTWFTEGKPGKVAKDPE